MQLRVMTFNLRVDVSVDKHLRFVNRLPYINHFLSTLHLDILATQEATLVMCEGLHMPNYHLIAKPREADGETTALFIHKRFTLLHSGFFWLSDTPDVESKHPDAGCKRLVTYANLQFHEDTFTVVNVHFDHESTTARTAGMSILLSRIKPYLSGPIIVLGDMNASLHEPLHELLHHHGLSHGYNKKQLSSTTFHGYSHKTKGEPIDFIYTNESYAFQEMHIIHPQDYPIYLSDHYPVFACLKKIA